MPGVRSLVTFTVFHPKIGEVENKIPDISGLIKEVNYNAKITDIEANYFTISDYSKFTSEILETNKKGFVDKSRISKLIENFDLNIKLTKLETKVELKTAKENSETSGV